MKQWIADFATISYKSDSYRSGNKRMEISLRKAINISNHVNWLWLMEMQDCYEVFLHNAKITLGDSNHLVIEGQEQEFKYLRENEIIHREDFRSNFYTTPELLSSARKRMVIPDGCLTTWKRSRFSKLFGTNKWACNYKTILVTNLAFPLINPTPYFKEYVMNDTVKINDWR